MDISRKIERAIKRWRRRLTWAVQVLCAKRHYYIDMQSYAFEHPEKMRILSLCQERLSYAYSDMNDPIHDDMQVWLKKACIHNATCFVYSDIILLDDGRCIYEMKELECLHPIVDFMDEILLKDTDKWCKLKTCKQTVRLKSAIKIGGMFGFNYYHFMYQLLPRLLESNDIDPSVPILLDDSARDIASMRQLVEWCNTEKREVIYMGYDVAYKVEDLYTISSPNFCVPNMKKSCPRNIPKAAYSKDCLMKMREILLPFAEREDTPKRIYICRSKAGKRRRYNEQELLSAVEPYDVKPLYPEELTIAGQMNVFRGANIIIAPTGAALSNLLFISEGANVIIFYNIPTENETHWATPIRLLGCKVFTMSDERILNQTNYQSDYYIKPKQLLEVIEKLDIV